MIKIYLLAFEIMLMSVVNIPAKFYSFIKSLSIKMTQLIKYSKRLHFLE